MKQIPKVYANKIDKKFENNETYYKSNGTESIEPIMDDRSIEQKIKEIFSSPRYIYRANVEIVLEDQTIVKKIIGKNGSNLITMDNELIPISNILDIKLKD